MKDRLEHGECFSRVVRIPNIASTGLAVQSLVEWWKDVIEAQLITGLRVSGFHRF